MRKSKFTDSQIMDAVKRAVNRTGGDSEMPDSQTVMAKPPKWFDDYNSYHPHSALGYVPSIPLKHLSQIRGPLQF